MKYWPFSRRAHFRKQLKNYPFVSSTEAICLEREEGVWLLNSHTGELCSLDGIAPRVWQKIRKPIRFEKLIDEVVSEYEVERQELVDDLESLLNKLYREQLIAFVPESIP